MSFKWFSTVSDEFYLVKDWFYHTLMADELYAKNVKYHPMWACVSNYKENIELRLKPEK